MNVNIEGCLYNTDPWIKEKEQWKMSLDTHFIKVKWAHLTWKRIELFTCIRLLQKHGGSTYLFSFYINRFFVYLCRAWVRYWIIIVLNHIRQATIPAMFITNHVQYFIRFQLKAVSVKNLLKGAIYPYCLHWRYTFKFT